MKRFSLALFFFVAANLCLAQNVYTPIEFPTVSSLYSPLIQANLPPNSPTLAVCHSPANQVPCTNYATTYTYAGVACPNGAQDVPQPATTSACQSTGDAQGNLGFWAPAGQYDYTVCIATTCLGPYTVSVNGSTGAGTITVNDGSEIPYPVNFQNGTNTSASNPSGSNVQYNVPSATSGVLGVLELTADFGGSATAPSVVNGSHITNASIPNSGLVNPSTTVNGTVCTLGSTCTPSSGGGGNPQLGNFTPDQTGNSVPYVIGPNSSPALTNYFQTGWAFLFNTTTYINGSVYIPTAQSGATVVVDVMSADSTAGHTALITYCDQVVNSGAYNVGAFNCASSQTFTTSASTYNAAQRMTFNVQSTLTNGSVLIVKIGTAPTGTAPTQNILLPQINFVL